MMKDPYASHPEYKPAPARVWDDIVATLFDLSVNVRTAQAVLNAQYKEGATVKATDTKAALRVQEGA